MDHLSQFEARVCHPGELTVAEVARWQELRAQHDIWRNPLVGPGFARIVGSVRDDARVLVVSQAGLPVAFWAHHRRPGRLGRSIGAPFSDYHAVICDPAVPLGGDDLVRLAGLRRFRHNGLVDLADRFTGLTEGETGYAITLEGSGEDYLETLRAGSPKRFKNYRRLRNRLEEAGPVRLVASRNRADFETLLAWKQAQFARTGLHDVLQPHWVRQLMDAIFEGEEMEGTGGLMLTLHAGDKLVAGQFGAREGEVFHPWIASTNPEFSVSSPGQAFLHYAIMAMPELGLRSYDLGTGHDHYKKPFANVVQTTQIGVTAPGGAAAAHEGEDFLGRVRRRLDHIAATELSLAGRAHGIVTAAMAIQRRNAHRVASDID